MPDIRVRRADRIDRPVLERLWQLFQHDLSEFQERYPYPDGSFRDQWLRAAFVDADWAPYLLANEEHPLGLATVRGLTGPACVMNGFFVVRGARRTGVGLGAARDVISRHPGRWEIPFQRNNHRAVRFWRTVASEMAGDAWREFARPVPGEPEVPPDLWISFDVSG